MMQFEFKNRVVLKASEKLIIAIINFFIYYLIIEINNTNLLLITKLIILDIKYEIFKNTNIINNNVIKFERKTRFY